MSSDINWEYSELKRIVKEYVTLDKEIDRLCRYGRDPGDEMYGKLDELLNTLYKIVK